MLLFVILALLTSGLSACTETRGESAREISIGDEQPVAALLPRKNEDEGKKEFEVLQSKYNESIQILKEKGFNAKAYITLASVYITECRITGNADYYNRAAVQVLDRLISSNQVDLNNKLEAYSLKSAVYLNMHQFEEGKKMALEGIQINPGNAGLYGALVDASVELGNYKDAVAYCDKMLSIRPDLRSYSRASYLRQIFGANQDAIDAMKMAVESGVPGNESTEWSRVHLGDLYMNIGKLKEAEAIYKEALSYRPNYPHAEIGLAKIDKLNKNYPSAIQHAKNAIGVLSEASFVSFLGELYELNGEKDKAEKVFNDVIKLLSDNDASSKDGGIEHNGNREYAMAYMDAKQYDKALEFAKKDLALRPENIDANDLVAWILYLKGDYKAALPYSEKVFSTKIKNADLSYKASLINNKAGNIKMAEQYKKDALAVSAYIDPRILQMQ